MTEQPVRYEVVDGVAWLTINRPETRNARNKAVHDGRTGAGHIAAPPDTAKAAAEDRVTGTALDFCLVVTQRRNLADTGLQVTGPAAAEWMTIAQAFADAPTDGRPRLFAPQPAGGRP